MATLTLEERPETLDFAQPRQPVLDDERRRLVEQHVRLAYWHARKMHARLHGAVELDALEGVAVLALCRAAASFDPARSRQGDFAPLANRAIMNALTDWWRTWRPRLRLWRRLGSGRPRWARNDLPWGAGDVPDPREQPPEDAAEARMTLQAVMRAMPGEARRVVNMRLGGLTLAEVGDRLGYSGAWVRKMEKRAIARARRALGVTPAP